MENDKNRQPNDQGQQQPAGEQNPTLHQPGSQVADYGNVTGGSADGNVEEGQQTANEGRSSQSQGNETMGNP